ncbi:anti-sigma regulatory factor (Ser/Thr protein kinase) [Desulfobotulus alkaliphilus]|uniref:Anti-sigma regulatory factor (Ser/Thr protein kinase) n=1 Tax=Desulfobotulus alkaliphilus TaxID=622671 RepID=A0A562RVG7_9BACT|nr:ATP-binding protein [Desulfobotulus alkaliphilus]TWI73061.1 anti-sigma regulatory factor (Ser/Thr protein kinase) [Desulfobotulus alkaliphilus]
MKKLRVEAVLDALERVLAFTGEEAEAAGLDPGKCIKLALVLEEAFVNICSYAYPEGSGFAEIFCGTEDRCFVVEIHDEGEAFNVLSLPDPDTSLGIEEREIGGLGIHFIRQFTDKVAYGRENNRNILTMHFGIH